MVASTTVGHGPAPFLGEDVGRYGRPMGASWVLARAGLRRHRRGLLGLSVVLALGLGVSMASLEAARRTENAYPAYLRRAEVGELAVNPNLLTDRAQEIIATTPGVAGVVSDAWLSATPDDGDPRTLNEVSRDSADVRVSADGRYVDRDRPAIHEGRMVHGGREAFVSVETATSLDLEVGDILPLAFWRDAPLRTVRTADAKVEPIGRSAVEVVGIGVFADEVLADDLYPRQRLVVSPDVGSRFDCTPPHPTKDDTRSLEQLAAAFIPPGCARSYRQFSVQVDDGDGGVAALMSALDARFVDENSHLPQALVDVDLGFSVIPSVTADVGQRVQSSLSPAVRALQLYSLASGTATLVVTVLGAARLTRRQEDDARTWGHLGTVRAQQVAGIAIPLAVSAAAGLAGSLVVAWLGSGLGPVASARVLEPAGRLGLAPVVALIVLGVSTTVLAAGCVLVAVVATRSRNNPVAGRSRQWQALPGAASPSLVLGVRAAVGSAGSFALLGGAVASVSALFATVVFTTSLGTLVSEGERFGWPYDAAVMIGYGYGGADQAGVAATLDRPEVRSWGLAALPLGVTVNGETLPVVAGQVGFDDLPVPVVEGRMPTGDDEIGLGALTAERLDVGVGDQVTVATSTGERAATVGGLVVLPPVGPFESDRASLGTGALLPTRFFAATRPEVDAIVPDAGGDAGSGNPFEVGADGSFVGIDLRDGVDGRQFLSSISAELPTWDVNRFVVLSYPDPVRPPQIADVAAVRAIPIALVGVFVLAMAGGLVLGISVATRARHRELALLRAVGATGRQLRASVRAQSLALVGVGLGIGIPVGLALGRVLYRTFATGLGALPQPDVSLPWTVVIVVSTIAVGVLAAAGPGRRAARARPAVALRHE